jgi:small neutral amino acid transporter SnatA (MarC family)
MDRALAHVGARREGTRGGIVTGVAMLLGAILAFCLFVFAIIALALRFQRWLNRSGSDV